jgi:glycosyltransferase involved in cell wall biosynthesis
MSAPILSIGFPVYNGEQSLHHVLDSILAQDFHDFEVVICDNASTDNTGAICTGYADRDKRIRYFRNETNMGANPNHDRTFHLSLGKYFMWTAHDLVHLPGMLRRCVETLMHGPPSVVLVYPRCEMIFDGRPLAYDARSSIESREGRPYRRLEKVSRHVLMVNQLYGLMRRDALSKTRLNGSYFSSDYVLLAELAMLGEIWEVPEVLIRRRIDSNRGTAAVCHDRKAWMGWLDSRVGAAKGAWLDTRERLALEYFRGAWHLPLKRFDKLLCLLVAPTLPYWRILLRVTGPWRHAIRRFTGRSRAATGS